MFTGIIEETGRIVRIERGARSSRLWIEGKKIFDYIFMDPPYNHGLERQVLEYLQDSSILDENTLIIVEADLTTDFGYVEDLGYRQLRSKEYKTNKHIFLCRGK